MPIQTSRRVPPPHKRHIAASLTGTSALLWAAALVIFNMHTSNQLAFVILLGCGATATIAVIISLIVGKVRNISARNSMDRYHGVMARAKREQERARGSRFEQWEASQLRAGPASSQR